jgi:dihydrofolate synthase/folylpolyglutamate synthase
LHRQGFPITPAAVAEGVRDTRWPGRLQIIAAKDGSPEYLLDVAHNPAGAWALRSALSALYEDRKITFVFGAMRDKAIRDIAEILFPLAERVIATPINNPRSATAEEIREAAARISSDIEAAADTASALQRAQATTPKDGVIVVTGSVYLVGEAMQALNLRIP